ncbi:polysaccharide biosynthesis protein [Thiorhodospira sibirica]|uniref:polysaccharide biosynthesis protein n=1 Tax=Thiorhodospira sibirica TaxID=154347 RepID=UPI00022C0BB4|nr:nucleoside-diphosphate sugar epimerase/dehydratase [Thiorhodospira sibirica]
MKLLPVLLNRWSAFAHDLLWIPVALLLAFWVTQPTLLFTAATLGQYLQALAITLPVQAIAYIYCGLYRGIWRFASLHDLMRILRAIGLGSAGVLSLLWLTGLWAFLPPGVILVYPLLLVCGLSAPRVFYRWFKDHRLPPGYRKRVLILGAGRAGELLVRELDKSCDYLPVGFLDDNPNKIGRDLHGVPVLGRVNALERTLREFNIDIVLIAMRTAGPRLMRQVVDAAAYRGVRCITLPSLQELTDGRVEISRLRGLEIEDLLGREEVAIDDAGLYAFLRHKRVLITGAAGSIGSELCRQVLRYQPAELIMLDQWEYGLYRIEQSLQQAGSTSLLHPLLANVSDAVRMRHVFARYRPQVVFHAAAYKQVPLVEENALEGVRVNVLGTQIVADLAISFGCERFLLVSTDKAVKPTNVMGASKRVAELYCQGLGALSEHTRFIITRFGNVMGSAGSVVPLFRRQIAQGGPVTVTHPDITRYFMTIPEAVSLILQAAAMGRGGEIFVLDMGKALRILDLAEEMIRLSGHEPERDIEIQFVGLRPGEKLHEELFYPHENPIGTQHAKILRAEAAVCRMEHLKHPLEQLRQACAQHDETAVLQLLQNLVPEFKPFLLPPSAVSPPTLKVVAGHHS